MAQNAHKGNSFVQTYVSRKNNPYICDTNLSIWIGLGCRNGAFLCLCVSSHIYKLEGLLMLLTSSPHIHEC